MEETNIKIQTQISLLELSNLPILILHGKKQIYGSNKLGVTVFVFSSIYGSGIKTSQLRTERYGDAIKKKLKYSFFFSIIFVYKRFSIMFVSHDFYARVLKVKLIYKNLAIWKEHQSWCIESHFAALLIYLFNFWDNASHNSKMHYVNYCYDHLPSNGLSTTIQPVLPCCTAR